MLLLADLYARYGSELRAADAKNPVAQQAAAAAVRLTRVNPSYRADYAWSLSARGDFDGMRKQYHQALRLDPANPYRWIEYAQLLSRSHRFDAEYTQSVLRVQQLAPNSPSIQLYNAWVGVSDWNFGDRSIRDSWARSMIHVLRNDPWKLLRPIVAVHREYAFCGFVGAELGLAAWCDTVMWLRPLCEQTQSESAHKPVPICKHFGLAS